MPNLPRTITRLDAMIFLARLFEVYILYTTNAIIDVIRSRGVIMTTRTLNQEHIHTQICRNAVLGENSTKFGILNFGLKGTPRLAMQNGLIDVIFQ